MLDGEARSASVETLTDAELLALPAGGRPAPAGGSPRYLGQADRRAHSAAAGDQRARGPPVVPDRPEPRRRRPHPADRRGGGAGGPARDHVRMTQADLAQLAGTSRESVSRFLATLERAGVVQRRAREGHRGRAPPAACLHLLMGRTPTPTSSPPSARTWSSGSFAGVGSATSACSRRWPRSPRAVRARALRRRAYADSRPADRPRADHLPALDRGRDLPGARAARASRACWRSGPAPGYSAAVLAMLAARGDHDRAGRGAGRRRPPAARGSRDRATSKSWSATAAPASRTARRTTRSPSTRPPPRRPRRLIAQLAPGGRLVVPIATDACRHVDGVPPARRDVDPATADGPRARRSSVPAAFVPLIGSEGYPE